MVAGVFAGWREKKLCWQRKPLPAFKKEGYISNEVQSG
jgi:hypothetical protein